MMVDGKKAFLKKLWLALMGGTFSELEVDMKLMVLELDDRDMMVIRFVFICKGDNF